jgi:hypothetical protein
LEVSIIHLLLDFALNEALGQLRQFLIQDILAAQINLAESLSFGNGGNILYSLYLILKNQHEQANASYTGYAAATCHTLKFF